VQALGELLVRVRLDRQRLADGEDLRARVVEQISSCVESRLDSGERTGEEGRTLKRNGRSSPNLATTLSPRSAGWALRCCLRSSPDDRSVEGQDGCVPIQSCDEEGTR